MKRVRIHAGIVGLVFKNGNYKRIITEGKHWVNFREQVIKYSLSQPFNAPRALEILLKDQALADMEALKISGKQVTPFLLNRIKEITDGNSLGTNIRLVESNVRLGCEIASELVRRET